MSEHLRRAKEEIETRYGPWTAHNIRLGDGVYTISPEPAGDEVKLRRVTQLSLDVLEGSLAGRRVLDLACLEGMYAIEFARRGATVVAIEGREANIAKARFAAKTLGVDVDFQLGDVRHLSREQHGEFDVVLALGILYHLDYPDLFSMIERISEVCRRALVVDTGVGSAGTEEIGDYRGVRLVEHASDSTPDERRDAVWSSLDNLTAVALTRPSLERALTRQGFTSVLECHVPAEPAKEVDRVTLLALKGSPAGDLVTPPPASAPDAVPEQPPLGRRLEAARSVRLVRYAVPPPLRARLRRLFGAETRRH
ncbi:MAG: methyltransferase domain-containing protein [Actinobacteria bacterium]|nr:methyltransferase domain-containing protein [Actinomycetota bacterium]